MADPDADHVPSSSPQVIFSSSQGRDSPPDLRILHYNDVYHVDESSAEPVGGLPRFMTLVKEYQESGEEPKVVTLFSGDAFNPSLESSVTKGSHMVPVLNAIGTDATCIGNHDLDFGVKQFESLSGKCNFPWLLANVLDPGLGEDVPLGKCAKTHLLTASNGLKVGLIGLGEREWLETINSLPPNLIYKSATQTAKELVPKLRENGADIVICLSHMREPNDVKLAQQTDGLIDIILGGHDHYYSHQLVNKTHVLRSGTDFKQLSFIEATRQKDGGQEDGANAGKKAARWDFNIWRRDVTSDIKPHAATQKLAKDLTSKLQKSLTKAVGWTASPLDGRFSTVRLRESNLGNFVCDIMRAHSSADLAIMAAGTIRGDQIYPPGALRIKDLITCFPFEDPCVVLRAKGRAIWEALENAVGSWPALEGRFPQVSGVRFTFDTRKEKGNRILKVEIAGEPLDNERKYTLATRGYMGRGKDGYTSLLVKSEGGEVEEVVDEENGVLISTLLRQYFLNLRTVGQWRNMSEHWNGIVQKVNADRPQSRKGDQDTGTMPVKPTHQSQAEESGGGAWGYFLHKSLSLHYKPPDENDESSYENWEHEIVHGNGHGRSGDKDRKMETEGEGDDDEQEKEEEKMDLEILLMRKFWGKWARKTGKIGKTCDPLKDGEYSVDWTRVIAPVVDGRMRNLAEE